MKISDNFEKDNLFFTSDTHFFHRSVISFCDRPYKNVEEMNYALIENWNKVVGVDDIVFHLGDIALGGSNKKVSQVLNKLNGKIYLVTGNHDYKILRTRYIRNRFEDISDLCVIKVTDLDALYGVQKLVLSHYPMCSWEAKERGSIQLFGHTHGSFKNHHNNQIEVGVDVQNYQPVSYNDVMIQIKNQWIK